MHWFILAALALVAAAVLWYTQAAAQRDGGLPPEEEEGAAFRRWLADPGALEEIHSAVDGLCGIMAHPDLGGPGFLPVRLPQPGEDGSVVVAAQYPNIRERLYRRVVRQELDRETLQSEGVSGALLALAPTFETDSGGIVVISVRAAYMEPGLVNCVSGRRERQAALRLLSDRLSGPTLEARPFGTELLLTPVRDAAKV